MSNQLSEALDRFKALEDASKNVVVLREELKKSEEEIESLKNQLSDFEESHENFVSEADALREKECEQAREEMIQRAEVRFCQANENFT